MKTPLISSILISAALTLALSAHAEWLGFRGPTQNGVTTEQAWNPRLASPPKALWKVEVGTGISSVTVADGRAYTMGNVDGKDVIHCLDAKTGKEVWRHDYPMSADPKLFEGGPRSTPVLDGNRLYAVSHQGDFWCLDAGTGNKIWYKHYQQDLGGRRPDWGYSASPLVKGNAVYCDVGGSGSSTVALDKATGKVLWKSGSDASAYSTPVVATLGGKETLVAFKANAVVGYDLSGGTELWRAPWKTSYDINAASPLALSGDRLFLSSGYNTGCALFRVQGGALSQVWKSKSLRTQINTAAPLQENLYGIDGDVGGGHLVCVSLADGTQRWQEKSVRGGALIESAGRLIVLSEKGELVICDASPEGFHPITRTQMFNKRCWAQPTLDGGRLYLRSNEGSLVCLDVSK